MTVVDRSHRIALVGSGGFYSHRCQIIFLLFSAIRVVYQYICKNVKYESYNLVSMRIMEAEYRERDLQQVQHQNKILWQKNVVNTSSNTQKNKINFFESSRQNSTSEEQKNQSVISTGGETHLTAPRQKWWALYC